MILCAGGDRGVGGSGVIVTTHTGIENRKSRGVMSWCWC